MQNTTIVWLSMNLMCNLSSKVFSRKIWCLLGLIFFPFSRINGHALAMQNTTIAWLSIDLMCNRSYKVFANLNLTGFTFSSEIILIKFSHIHWHALVMQITTIVWLSINLMCNLRYNVSTNLTLTGFTFLPNSFAIVNFNHTVLKIRLFLMMYLHA